MNKYLVSLIIPCYNITKNTTIPFEDTIESIKNQTIGFENIELILVNNGSTDNTKQILEKTGKYPNVNIINIYENSGSPSVPRNIGIEKSTSDYLVFLDDDDSLNENALYEMYENITRYDLDFVQINYYLINDKKIKNPRGLNKRLFLNNKEKELIENYDKTYIWNSIYNKKFLIKNNIKFLDIQYHEDSLFNIDCLTRTNKDILVLNDSFGINHYIENNSSITSNILFNERIVDDFYIVANKNFESLINYKINKNFMEYYMSFYKSTFMFYFIKSEKTANHQKIYEKMEKLLKKYKKYPLVNIIDYPLSHNIFYKLMNYLIINNHKRTAVYISKILKRILN